MATELQTYKAEYCWTEQEFVRSSKLNGRVHLRSSIVIAANLTALFLIAVSGFFLVVQGLNSSNAVPLLVITTLCSCWLFRAVGTNRWLRKMFRKNPSANVLMQWEFTVETVKTHCEDLSAGIYSWKLVSKLGETTDGFLFYIGGACLWLPFRAFEKPEGIEMVRDFAKINGVKYFQAKG